MGSIEQSNGTASPYSVPKEAASVFKDGLLSNSKITENLPPEAVECSRNVRFVGSDAPSIPINWRFAESAASLKGLEATYINSLLKRKYGVEPPEVVINTYVHVEQSASRMLTRPSQ